MTVADRKLSRNETHDLGMIIKDRAKVLRAHIDSQAATVLADFEQKLAAEFSFDDDEIWKRAMVEVSEVVGKANVKIAGRCDELGIPKRFQPRIGMGWIGRQDNALEERRRELRRVAKSRVEAMSNAAFLKIEQQSLDLRTQVVAMGLLSDDAKLFLESLAPVEEAMRMLEFKDIDAAADQEKAARRRLGY